MKHPNKDNFYEELDSRRYRHPASCSVLIAIFIIFTIAGSIFAVWGINQLRDRFNPNFHNKISNINIGNLPSTLQDYLTKSNPDSQKVTVVITDEDLTTILEEASQTDSNFNLTKPKAVITSSQINLAGKLVKPFVSRIIIEIVPKVSDGKLSLDVSDVKLANLTLPAFLRSRVVEPILNKSILKTLNNESIYYDSVKLSDHKMTLTGHKQ